MAEQLAESNDSLNDLFDESSDLEVKSEEKTETKTETEAEKEPENIEKDAESKSEDDNDKQAKGLRAALTAERKKRQALEKQIKDEAEQKLIPDSNTHPQEKIKYLESKNSRIGLDTRIELSIEVMRDSKDDYDKYEDLFMEAVSEKGDDGKPVITDQALYKRFSSAKNPAKFAYEEGLKREAFLEKSHPDYENNLRKQLAEEFLEKHKANKDITALELSNLTSTAASGKNDQKLPDRDDSRIDAYDD